jgi:hypothetical protein
MNKLNNFTPNEDTGKVFEVKSINTEQTFYQSIRVNMCSSCGAVDIENQSRFSGLPACSLTIIWSELHRLPL